MDNNWTYKHADINKNLMLGIKKELENVWQEYTYEKHYNTCRFIYLLTDQDVRNKCPILIQEITRLGLGEILEGVGFLVVPPGCYTPLHIDNGVTITLSIPVINCENSYTVWYKDPEPLSIAPELDCIGDDTILNPVSASEDLVEYLRDPKVPYFKIDPAKELDRVECNRSLWLNTSIPHRPEVLHNYLRVLATIRFNKLPEIF